MTNQMDVDRKYENMRFWISTDAQEGLVML